MVVTDKQIEEEEAKFNEVTMSFDQLLADLQLTREQLKAFTKDPEQFTEEDWQTMESMRSKFDSKLSQMPLHRHSAATRKSLASIQPTWIYVR